MAKGGMERLDELLARVEELDRNMKQVQSRLRALEKHSATTASELLSRPPSPEATVTETSAPVVTEAAISAGTVSLVGRSLMVLAGAYLLRAVTDSGAIPALAGVAAGLIYATWWLVSSDRAAGSKKRMSAGFHAFTAMVIAYPLIGEATARMGLVGASAGASLVAFFFVLALAVAWRRDLAAVAWTNVILAIVTTLGLFVATRALMSYVLALLVIAGALEVLAYRDRWLGLRWPVAIGLDATVLVLADIASRPSGPPEGYASISASGAIAVGLILPGLYLGSLVTRTLIRRRRVELVDGFDT